MFKTNKKNVQLLVVNLQKINYIDQHGANKWSTLWRRHQEPGQTLSWTRCRYKPRSSHRPTAGTIGCCQHLRPRQRPVLLYGRTSLLTRWPSPPTWMTWEPGREGLWGDGAYGGFVSGRRSKRENTVLREQVGALLRANGVQKRAVVIQHQR